MEQRDLLGEPIRPFRLAKYPEREAQPAGRDRGPARWAWCGDAQPAGM